MKISFGNCLGVHWWLGTFLGGAKKKRYTILRFLRKMALFLLGCLKIPFLVFWKRKTLRVYLSRKKASLVEILLVNPCLSFRVHVTNPGSRRQKNIFRFGFQPFCNSVDLWPKKWPNLASISLIEGGPWKVVWIREDLIFSFLDGKSSASQIVHVFCSLYVGICWDTSEQRKDRVNIFKFIFSLCKVSSKCLLHRPCKKRFSLFPGPLMNSATSLKRW